jgi:hypothetical protein
MLLLRAASLPCSACPRRLFPPLCRSFTSPSASPPLTWGVCDYGRLGQGDGDAATAWRWAAVDALTPAPVALALASPCAVSSASCGEACVPCCPPPPITTITFVSSQLTRPSCPAATHSSSTPAARRGPLDSTKGSAPPTPPLAPACSCSFLRLQWAAGHRQHGQHVPPPARHPQAPRRLPLRRRRSLRIRHAPRSRPRLLPSHHVCVPASNPTSPLIFSRVSCRGVVPVRQQQTWAAGAT